MAAQRPLLAENARLFCNLRVLEVRRDTRGGLDEIPRVDAVHAVCADGRARAERVGGIERGVRLRIFRRKRRLVEAHVAKRNVEIVYSTHLAGRVPGDSAAELNPAAESIVNRRMALLVNAVHVEVKCPGIARGRLLVHDDNGMESLRHIDILVKEYLRLATCRARCPLVFVNEQLCRI